MPHEVIYTSVPEGLNPGSSGFCVVVSTPHVPDRLATDLDLISRYRHVEGHSDRGRPVDYSLLQLSVAGIKYLVLSRIGPVGVDYACNANHLAHHVALEDSDFAPRQAGDPVPNLDPVFLMDRQQGLLRTDWTTEDKPDYRAPRRLPEGTQKAAKCEHWERLARDAGWGGYLANTARDSSVKHVTLVFEPAEDVLPLILESLRLLDVRERWDVTFSSYFTQLPLECPDPAIERRLRPGQTDE